MASTAEIDCPLCDGAGHWEKECHECGNSDLVDCEACDKNFKCVPANVDWDDAMIDEAFGYFAYRKAMIQDVAAIYSWTGQMPSIPDFGLKDAVPFCDLESRKIQVAV